MDRAKGPYYVDNAGFAGQNREDDIRNYNSPPAGQPGLWCRWAVIEAGTSICWNGVEKFYYSAEWMKYLIDHFLAPNAHAKGEPGFEGFTFNHVVNGTIDAQGEEPDDRWKLIVKDNVVYSSEAVIGFSDPIEVIGG